MNSKIFFQRFNHQLSSLDFPKELNEKTKAVVKVFEVSHYLAREMIFGNLPSHAQLNHIAKVLEVCPQWLGGATDRKKVSSGKEESEKV